MNRSALIIGNLKVQPSCITHYFTSAVKRGRSAKQVEAMRNLSNNKSTTFSQKSAGKLRNYINWFIAASKNKRIWWQEQEKFVMFRINFITLTLPAPQQHSDREIKSKCLNQFLSELRRKYGLKNYIWRAESQSNGNIHFHITTDTYIHYSEIRLRWNRCVAKLGYIEKFFEKHNHRNPPSTEIKAVRNIKNLSAYLSKYLTKADETRRLIEGRQYYVSDNIRNNSKLTLEEGEEAYSELEHVCKNSKVNKVIKTKHCTLYIDSWHTAITEAKHTYINELYTEVIKRLSG